MLSLFHVVTCGLGHVASSKSTSSSRDQAEFDLRFRSAKCLYGMCVCLRKSPREHKQEKLLWCSIWSVKFVFAVSKLFGVYTGIPNSRLETRRLESLPFITFFVIRTP